MEKLLNIALIGHGYLGRWHAQKVEQTNLAQLKWICERDPSAHQEIKELYPQAQVVSEIKDIDISELDGVLIVTPSSLHCEQVLYFLNQGISVFCEKPLCLNQEELTRIEKALNNSRAKLQVGHSERFQALWKEKGLLEGLPQLFEFRRLSPPSDRALDTDVVQDLMIHDIDLAFFILQEETLPAVEYAHGIKSKKGVGWDFVDACVRWPSGVLARFVAGRNHYDAQRSCTVWLADKTRHINFLKQTCLTRSYHRNQLSEYTYEKQDHLFLEQKEFYLAIQHDRETVVPFSAARKALHISWDIISKLS